MDGRRGGFFRIFGCSLWFPLVMAALAVVLGVVVVYVAFGAEPFGRLLHGPGDTTSLTIRDTCVIDYEIKGVRYTAVPAHGWEQFQEGMLGSFELNGPTWIQREDDETWSCEPEGLVFPCGMVMTFFCEVTAHIQYERGEGAPCR